MYGEVPLTPPIVYKATGQTRQGQMRGPAAIKSQAKQFTQATEVSSLAVTKLDGTAKGGVVIGISDQFQIPVKYIGVGEGINDLQAFNKMEFVDSFFKRNN